MVIIMEIGKPNIHIFELYNEYYIYDVGTNGIISTSKELCLFLLRSLSEPDIKVPPELEEELRYLLDLGYLKERNKDAVVFHAESSMLENLYKNNLKMIILQVTQNCNLRCQYCVYSGSYVNRVHNNKRMSLETAKQAIAFLARNSGNSKDISIGFYGGEPLLEFDLIKQVVSYAEDLFVGKKVSYSMTTNATLLDVEKARYMYENNFDITVSLDGPKEAHDSNRIFASSNKGTFDKIMQNLEVIKNEIPEFIHKIGFNAVIDLKQNVSCSSDFFLNYDTVKGLNVTSNYINDVSKKEEEQINPELIAVSYYEIFKVYIYACRKERFHQYKPTLYSSEMSSLKQMVVDRFVGKNVYAGRITPGGQCLPGIQRLFVKVDGTFLPCERLTEDSKDLWIGNLEDGFHIENAKKILNISKITEAECSKCWCYKMCNQCVTKAGETGKIEKSSRLKWCEQTREGIEHLIKNYILLKHTGCSFEEGEVE